MAQQGDRYVVELKEPHLQWGEYRYTDTRETVKDEGYIPIPLNDARRLELVNSNATGGKDMIFIAQILIYAGKMVFAKIVRPFKPRPIFIRYITRTRNMMRLDMQSLLC